jgi:hypothetical protein
MNDGNCWIYYAVQVIVMPGYPKLSKSFKKALKDGFVEVQEISDAKSRDLAFQKAQEIHQKTLKLKDSADKSRRDSFELLYLVIGVLFQGLSNLF